MSFAIFTFNQHVNCFAFCDAWMEPAENGVRINVFIQIFDEVAEDHALLAGAMSGDPQPAVSHIIVDKEYVSFLETKDKHKKSASCFRTALRDYTKLH